MSLQRTYQINPEVGFPGQIAEPNSPHRIEVGYLHVDTGAARANPRPGDSVFYNDGQDAWQVPITGPDHACRSVRDSDLPRRCGAGR